MVTTSVENINETMDYMYTNVPVIHRGDIVLGKVISVSENEVMVNIGYMADGIISKDELSYDKNINTKDIIKEDDEIYVYILKVSDEEGNVVLSKKRADSIKVWDELKEYYKKGTNLDIVTKEKVNGGLTAEIKGLRAFIPVSQLSISYVENLDDYVGKKLTVKIIDLEKDKKKIVLSAKEVQKEELKAKRDKLWADIKKGEKRKGKVSKLTKFGAFVDLGGIDGLIHISDLSWRRVSNPSEVVKVGDSVEVYVLDFDKDKKRISLALKDVNLNPWDKITQKYKIGDIVEGTVVKIADFGAFIEIEPGIEGLVHVTELSNEMNMKPSSIVNIGDIVKVKILDIDENKKKLSLSMKEVSDKTDDEFISYSEDEEKVTVGDLLKDKLKNLNFD
ncbi:hypothetical protein CLTEP_01570 [Clostridium tepidiprofundi DSM 19306]|uniref:S1 motif domain-containing protein n=1 Tax=Clostridium tepidiprofundi DSM 19306 TaxID=1121338 RepID=A0A151B7A3_9CLOT|nr:30S ribosomal protein S1 [Clostridium tepidiprofundi]KYH35764.1 hypothetical protein CLTEP_01570 [Clostridium tepidiprofundi DSM 19306]